MGHKHSRETLLAAALEVVASDGLHRLSFGRVAARAGTSDRVVVYYFATKDELTEAVLSAVGAALSDGLAPALLGLRAAGHQELVRRVWVVVSEPAAHALVAIYVQALGLAAAGVAPYTVVVADIVTSWTTRFEEHLAGDAQARRSQALAALAVLDGLLLVRLASGADIADEAAQALGVA